MQDTHWDHHKTTPLSYQEVYAMVLQYNRKVGLKDKIPVLKKNKNLLDARRTMLNQLKDRFASVRRAGSSSVAAASSS